ncbi:sensor histidine kinase [Paenibacillus aurantiacus]|uniref:Sensor histidine kinase n=1 Tax=Paenibacillus aurantiacus TaxID=1936118 RepID=A0ABV5KXI0_9BACL
MDTGRHKERKLGYLPIGYKLMLSYLVFTVLLVAVNFYVSHSMYESSMRRQTRANLQGTIAQIRDNVAYKLDDMVRISERLYYKEELIESLRKKDEGFAAHLRAENIIVPELKSALQSIGMAIRLSVYFHNPTVRERYHDWNSPDNRNLAEDNYDILQMGRIMGRSWYQSLEPEQYGQTMVWKQVEEDARDGRISLVRRLVDNLNPLAVKEIAVMRFSLPIRELFESVDYRKLGGDSRLTVTDANGRVVFESSGRLGAGMGLAEEGAQPEFLTIVEDLPQPGWRIAAKVPLTVIDQESKQSRSFIIGLCVLCTMLFTIAGYFISRYFAKRVMKFVAVLHAFREGDLHKRMTYKGKDEFSQIATALNSMGEEIEALINKVYLTQLQKKEAELEMLQLQINPHFLYNALSSINQLAKFGENEKLQSMVMGLAKFYRLSLNSGRTMIPVADELEQAGAYLDLQRVKYGSRMEVTMDIDANVWPYETVKLLLQPFIENVFKHAWCGDRIHIRIAAYVRADTIHYLIIDDGLGMPRGRIADILGERDDGTVGCGIHNIIQRVKLHYGEGSGIAIDSLIGAGTTVHVRIPARRRKLPRREEGERDMA